MHKTILITGGAGYVGSHISWLLAHHGYKVIIIDNFHQQQHVSTPWATVITSDFADEEQLHTIFTTYTIDTVIHCAAFIEVGASIKEPRLYYENNLFKTGKLLNVMLSHGVRKIIFSSSCAVYGIPQEIPIAEDHPRHPISVYGRTKSMVESMLTDFNHAYDLKFVSLRYFNAAGAQPEHHLGEQHRPETHIIPLLLQAIHQQKPFTLFGNDYETPDGSCIRDFLHVTDIAHAHLLALQHLEHHKPSDSFNLGTGHGISMKQLIKTAEQLFCTSVRLIIEKRRPGDPARLIADPSKAEQILGWHARYSDIEYILLSAYAYMIQQDNMFTLAE
jgi:UDP-glucose 4-epimerase